MGAAADRGKVEAVEIEKCSRAKEKRRLEPGGKMRAAD
jgi:hypothetical protein